ncbi:MAG: restriction endonuclease [Verrucomicrobiota bacterium]
MNSSKKGKELEWAVKWLEERISEKFEQTRSHRRKIQTNKHVVVEGVEHEIDVWVEEIRDSPPNLVYIFECKNWKKKVGKKELPDFIKKIEDISAAHGFFVAPDFTQGAKNLANQYNRLTLLRADLNPAKFLARIEADFNTLSIRQLSLTVQYRDSHANLDIKNAVVRLDNKIIDLQVFCHQLAKEEAQRIIQSDNRFTRLKGSHTFPIKFGFDCHNEELVVDGHDIASFIILGDVSYEQRPFTVERFYDIEKRGYVSKLGGVNVQDLGDITLEITGKLD